MIIWSYRTKRHDSSKISPHPAGREDEGGLDLLRRRCQRRASGAMRMLTPLVFPTRTPWEDCCIRFTGASFPVRRLNGPVWRLRPGRPKGEAGGSLLHPSLRHLPFLQGGQNRERSYLTRFIEAEVPTVDEGRSMIGM